MVSLRFIDELTNFFKVREEFESLAAQLRAWAAVEHNEDGTHIIPTPTGIVPIGASMQWFTADPPEGWRILDGSNLNRVTFKTLYELWGTAYGVGDGATTFGIPDMRQRFPIGKAASGTGSTLGGTGGAIDHTHSIGSHNHSISSGGSHSHGGSTSTDGSHSHSQGAHSHAISSVDEAEPGAGPDIRASSTQTDINNDAGTSTNGSHNHSVSTSSDGSHDHGGSTGSSSGTSGTGNPPFIAVNFIVYTGVVE